MNYERFGVRGIEVAGSGSLPWPRNCMITLTGFAGSAANLTGRHRCLPTGVVSDVAPWLHHARWIATVPNANLPLHSFSIRVVVSFRPSPANWSFSVRITQTQNPTQNARGRQIFTEWPAGNVGIDSSFNEVDTIPNPGSLFRSWRYRVGLWTEFPPGT